MYSRVAVIDNSVILSAKPNVINGGETEFVFRMSNGAVRLHAILKS